MANNTSKEEYDELRRRGYKTYEEMSAELKQGLRLSITHEDVMNAEELERALYPASIIYPEGDEIYEALEDVEISYMTFWSAPFTGGGSATLPKGEKVKISAPNRPKPTSVYCNPVNYKELHNIIVPERDRKTIDYGGYYFCIDTLTLNTKFKKNQRRENFWESLLNRVFSK